MDTLHGAQSSRRVLSAILRADPHLRRPRTALPTYLSRSHAPLRRHASDKPIVLEQPDKFRPPSHGQRLGRARPRLPASYNQGTSRAEKEIQKTRKYPHMFPNEGTGMHWFLTNRYIHVWITVGTLVLLALITMTQTFLQTSPYAHLIPPLSSLPFHPISYFREAWSVFRLHLAYTTEQTAESRKQNILDAQKRRLFRRAHGMEDLNAEEEQGIDVRGLVPWDDGLTNKERAAGGRGERMTGRMVVEQGGQVGEDIDEFVKRRDARKEGREVVTEVAKPERQGDVEQPQKRQRKLFFGIW